MAKLSFREIVQKGDHRWRCPLNQKEDLTRPVVEGWVGETYLSSLRLVLVPSSSTSLASRHPDTPKIAPITADPDQDLIVFD